MTHEDEIIIKEVLKETLDTYKKVFEEAKQLKKDGKHLKKLNNNLENIISKIKINEKYKNILDEVILDCDYITSNDIKHLISDRLFLYFIESLENFSQGKEVAAMSRNRRSIIYQLNQSDWKEALLNFQSQFLIPCKKTLSRARPQFFPLGLPLSERQDDKKLFRLLLASFGGFCGSLSKQIR